VYEILPEGAEEIDKTESEGFNNVNFGEIQPDIEILSIVDEVIKEIQDSQLEEMEKNAIVGRLSKLKSKLEI
jgi:hypothetical protein